MQMPHPPIARIYVQAFSHCAGSHQYLSCECTTPEEWDWEINRLKVDLELLRSEGHGRFAADRQMQKIHSL